MMRASVRGDGRRGEDEHVRVFRLLREGGALVHAEAVLLVRHDKAEPAVLHVGREEGMGADAEVDLPALQPSENFAALLCARRAREQRASAARTARTAARDSRNAAARESPSGP